MDVRLAAGDQRAAQLEKGADRVAMGNEEVGIGPAGDDERVDIREVGGAEIRHVDQPVEEAGVARAAQQFMMKIGAAVGRRDPGGHAAISLDASQSSTPSGRASASGSSSRNPHMSLPEWQSSVPPAGLRHSQSTGARSGPRPWIRVAPGGGGLWPRPQKPATPRRRLSRSAGIDRKAG